MPWFPALYGLFGALVGVFLNVPLNRLPAGKRLSYPPRCISCDRSLGPWVFLPVLGYLTLRGRCPLCGAPLSRRTPWVEVACGALFALLACLYGPTLQLALKSLYAAILLFLAVYDLEHKKILNVVILPATVLVLLAAALQAALGWRHFAPLRPAWPLVKAMAPGLVNAPETVGNKLLGGAFALAVFGVLWLINRNFAAEGDVKMALFAGMLVGYPAALIVILGSLILSGLSVAALLLTRKVTLKSAVPFAPFLSIATFIAML